ncbi:hypothetical protein GW17_00036852 [Ensete ventricosum]|nr:hypothetical protein GW17_00036852 [Ensete ventricosum]
MGELGRTRLRLSQMGKEGSVITKPPPMKKAFSGRYHGVKGELLGLGAAKVAACGKRQALFCNHLRMALFVFGLMGSFFVLDSLMLVVIHHFNFRRGSALRKSSGLQVCVSLVPGPSSISKESHISRERTEKIMHGRLVALGSAAVTKVWITFEFARHTMKRSGFILVSANGGLNQQRVAITDNDIRKESTPDYFLKVILPLLRRNSVVHFLGFGNRLAFDPLPLDLQVFRTSNIPENSYFIYFFLFHMVCDL